MDPFKVLGISSDSSDDEIKRAYLKLAKEWHPDTNKNLIASDKFKMISSAYDILRTKEKRQMYIKDKNDDFGQSSRIRKENINRAEDAIKFKNKYRNMAMFEKLVHPKTLMVLIPVAILVQVGMSSYNKEPKNAHETSSYFSLDDDNNIKVNKK